MGSDDHHLSDLKVTIQSTSMVFPSQGTERRSMFLSNIDQVLNFDVQTVHFFRANPDFPPETVAEKLKSALSQALVVYDFLGGRMKQNPQSGRLEVDCNATAAGAGYVVASSELTMDEIGDLVYPNPGFRQLVVHNMDGSPSDDQPLCMFQVTSFKCGGFAIGVTTNHAAFDGISFKGFLLNLASLAGDKPLSTPPCNDRHLLAARSPPQVTFPHPELLRIPPDLQSQTTPTVFDAPEVDLDFKTFRLTSQQIAHLKQTAKGGLVLDNSRAKITGFNVVTAHVWRCKALSSSDNHPDHVSTILYAVDIRRRLSPPLPSSYAGNAVLSGYAMARCSELEEGPFSKLVEMVTDGSLRMTDEYVRSVIDWGEVNKGFPNGEAMISSWWRLGFNEVEYPWGKPLYSCPVVYHRKDIILYFPDMSENGLNGDECVNVLVALPADEMRKFEDLFHKFLGMMD